MTKRELIFNAAAKLFAERSFNSVGIRDIANEAGVNSAMISYYFGGKANLLREIFVTFADLIHDPYEEASQQARDINDLADKTVVALLKAAGENQDVFIVGLRELNSDSPELQDLRTQVRDRGQETFSETLVRLGLPDTMPSRKRKSCTTRPWAPSFPTCCSAAKRISSPRPAARNTCASCRTCSSTAWPTS
jgi:AcrR family transcriptional regulator